MAAAPTSYQIPPSVSAGPSPSPAPSDDGPGGLFIAAGLITGVVVVISMIAVALGLLYYHRRQLRLNRQRAREAERERRLNEELPEGEQAPMKIPVIVVLPDNKLRFGWEVLPEEGGAGGLERYPSSSIKSSLGDEEEGQEGYDLERGQGSSSGSAVAPRCRPPLASVHVHVVDERF